MADTAPWQLVTTELDRWAADGRTARLWLRDDDAIAQTPALARLAAMAGDRAVPMLLAVIPLAAQPSLFAFLESASGIELAVHGARHLNHAPADRKSEEMAPERGRAAIADDLRSARASLTERLGATAGVWYVPPWNRIHPTVAAWLPEFGFTALSTFGAQRVAVGTALVEINAHVDLIDWRDGRRGRSEGWVAAMLAEELQKSRTGSGHAVGILAHHLAHDDACWTALAALFNATCDHPAVAWTRPRDLIAMSP